MEDAQRAMSFLRHHATTYDIDPARIGVIGFSAGAHLAAALSNASQRTYDVIDEADLKDSRPDFAIVMYPGRFLSKTKPATNLQLAPWMEISSDAPPTLLIHAMNDAVNDVGHSMAYALALNEAGVPVDLRIFAKGCHAFGLRETPDPITQEWPDLALKWLRNLEML